MGNFKKFCETRKKARKAKRDHKASLKYGSEKQQDRCRLRQEAADKEYKEMKDQMPLGKIKKAAITVGLLILAGVGVAVALSGDSAVVEEVIDDIV